MRAGEDLRPLRAGLEGREDLAVGAGRVADDPSHGDLPAEGTRGVDHVDAHRHPIDFDGQGGRLAGLLREFPQVGADDRGKLGVAAPTDRWTPAAPGPGGTDW